MPMSETKPQTEPKRVKIGAADDLTPGSSKIVVVGERKVAVFNIDGNLYAIDDRCPHRGASLGKGTRDGFVVTCPLHKWEFDLRTGQCVGQPGNELRRFEVFVAGDSLLLDVSSIDEEKEPVWDGIYRYLVRYGAMGWVGRFGSVDRIECSHGDRVMVQTIRGIEIGQILAGPMDGSDDQNDAGNHQPSGELLRGLTAADEQQHDRSLRNGLSDVFEQCQKLLSDREVAVEVIDCERLFDNETIVLYFLGQESTEMQPIAEELGKKWQAKVLFNPVIEPAASGGCGSGGCGSGGCGSGGCGA
ncbi:MAG: Rieske 2Fe-2S domain-containing protein [Planctomycetes bacterium]|nr:Rieske 2Fe-2S domain-containing protein [Planctomycetota bacterium]